MTIPERAAAYNTGKWGRRYPASQLSISNEQGRDALYGIWATGQNYRSRSTLYGAYPPTYVERVMSMFPDVYASRTLHAFSGSLPAGPYVRCDSVAYAENVAEIVGDICEIAKLARYRFSLILADPPYSAEDAKHYGTKMINRRRVLSELAKVVDPGGHLAWLDTQWPMHRKDEWLTVGRIFLIRSTNHRFRGLTLFERA